MTKKDYEIIASILFEANKHLTYQQANAVLDHAYAVLVKDNPKFNRAKFAKQVALPTQYVKRVLRDQGR